MGNAEIIRMQSWANGILVHITDVGGLQPDQKEKSLNMRFNEYC